MLKILLVLLLSCVGAVINFVPAPYDTDAVFAFGFSLCIFIGLLWGGYYALVSLVIVATPILVVSPSLTLGLLCAHTLLVGFVCKRDEVGSPIKISLLYWILVASPIQFASYYLQQSGFYENDAATVLANGINGIAVGLIGHAIFLATGILNLHSCIKSFKMAFLFRYFFTVLFFIAIMVLSYFFIGVLQSEQLDDLEAYLTQRSHVVADQLDDFLNGHANAISLTTTAIQETPESRQNRLTDTAVSFPEFLTLLISDKNGDIVYSFPESLLDRARNLGQANIASRDYFIIPKQQSRLYVSPVFKGRGFGDDPIVAISAPLFNQDLEFSGIVEGSLNLDTFRLYDHREFRPSVSTVIADHTGSIVYASEILGIAPLSQMASRDCIPRTCDIDLTKVLNPEEWVIAGQNSDLYGWQVFKVYPRSIFVHQLTKYASIGLFIIVLLTLVANVASYLIANTFSSPLTRILESFDRFDPTHPKQAPRRKLAEHYLVEIEHLDEGFNKLTNRLAQLFSQLSDAKIEQMRLNYELQTLNDSLGKRVEEKTRSLEIVAREAQQANEAKSQFLANVSHELRTPMNGIIGSVQNLQGAKIDVESRRKLDVIHKSAISLMSLLNSVLDWSKIEAGKMQLDEVDFDPINVLENCVLLHKSVATDKGLDLRLVIDEQMPKGLHGDENKLIQIVNNLMSNALKFTTEGFVTIKAVYKSDWFELEVRDSGIGIRKSEQERVLSEFTQEDASTTRLFGGTGLGLPICRALAELMNGRLRLESTAGVGTTVFLSVPLKLAKAGLAHSLLTTEQRIPNGTKILLAEDNDINSEVVQGMLADQDIKIIRVPNGEVALAAINSIEFDIILMDCQMPKMDGYQASRKIRQLNGRNSQLPIIALTANAYQEDRQRCLDAGMNDHIAKPIDKNKLISTVCHWLAARPAMPSNTQDDIT